MSTVIEKLTSPSGGFLCYVVRLPSGGVFVVPESQAGRFVPPPPPEPPKSGFGLTKKPKGMAAMAAAAAANGGQRAGAVTGTDERVTRVIRDSFHKDALCPRCDTYHGDRNSPVPFGPLTCRNCGAKMEVILG